LEYQATDISQILLIGTFLKKLLPFSLYLLIHKHLLHSCNQAGMEKFW